MTRPTSPIQLHWMPLSGHAHRVELFLSLLGLPFERIEVDWIRGAHKTPAFLARNPFGQLPVITDGALTLFDSNAILVYLAIRYDAAGRWLPRDATGAAQVQQWLSTAAGELAFGPATARFARLVGVRDEAGAFKLKAAQELGARLFDVMERHLAERRFLVGEEATIADLAMYSYTAHAPEGGIALDPHPAIRAWLARVESLPGFVPLARESTLGAA